MNIQQLTFDDIWNITTVFLLSVTVSFAVANLAITIRKNQKAKRLLDSEVGKQAIAAVMGNTGYTEKNVRRILGGMCSELPDEIACFKLSDFASAGLDTHEDS